MARSGLTKDEVFEVCDDMLRRGERPTQQSVRAQLGTGSMSTIQRAIDAWWTTLASRLDTGIAAARRPDVPEPVLALAGQLWAEAVDAAAAGLTAERAEAQARLDADRSALNADRANLQRQVAAAEAAAAKSAQARLQADARAAGLDAALAVSGERLADALSRLEVLTREHANAREAMAAVAAQLDAARAEAAERETDLQQHLRTVEDRAHAEVDRARQAQKLADEALRRLEDRLRTQEQQAQGELAATRRQIAEATQAAAVAQAERDRLTVEVASLQALLEKALAPGREALEATGAKAGATRSGTRPLASGRARRRSAPPKGA